MGWNFTQSLGDTIGKQCGICCDPEVKVAARAQSPHTIESPIMCGMQVVDWNQLAGEGGQNYIVIASDGLWEFVSSREVIETVAQGGSLNEISQTLITEARSRWRRYGGEDIDDTTVTLIKLQNIPSPDSHECAMLMK
jgi:serine/threonine protein phosphatase PrpC